MIDKPFHQTRPFIVPTDDGKTIEEHFGLASAGDGAVSIARMVAPSGWSEPPQTPEFGEYTLMVRGKKRVELPDGPVDLSAGESLYVPPGTRVRYANPFGEDAEYWSVCTPAFSIDLVHREDS
jgi:mannose-6-phosphate isomerase-like protein (cupin superfamily)